MTTRRLFLVLLVFTPMTAGSATVARASTLSYTFTGQVRLLDEYAGGGARDRYVDSSTLSGTTISVGDRFEAVLSFTPVAPGQVDSRETSTTSFYLIPHDTYSFNYTIEGQGNPGRTDANDLQFIVERGAESGHIVAYSRFDTTAAVPNNVWQEVQLYTRDGASLADGLPTDASVFDLDRSYLVMRPYVGDQFLQVVLSLDSIHIELDGELPPVEAPGTDPVDVPPVVPEPAALAVFVGLAAVVISRHHQGRGGSAGS